jgi:hypothetical protein
MISKHFPTSTLWYSTFCQVHLDCEKVVLRPGEGSSKLVGEKGGGGNPKKYLVSYF